MKQHKKSKRCNKCQGKGVVKLNLNRTNKYHLGSFPCTACKGTGKIKS